MAGLEQVMVYKLGKVRFGTAYVQSEVIEF